MLTSGDSPGLSPLPPGAREAGLKMVGALGCFEALSPKNVEAASTLRGFWCLLVVFKYLKGFKKQPKRTVETNLSPSKPFPGRFSRRHATATVQAPSASQLLPGSFHGENQ